MIKPGRRPDPTLSPPVHSCLYSLGMMALGAVGTLALLLLLGYAAAATIVAQFAEPVTFGASPAAPTPTELPVLVPAATPTPFPELLPEPTPRPPGRYDVQLRISEAYLNSVANQSIPTSGIGAGIDTVDLDIRPGNIIVLRARPVGARDLALSFTGQLSLAGNRIAVTPLSSSLLLLPFRGQIAEVVEEAINTRMNAYRNAVGFRILAIQTSETDLIADLRLT
ncbi:MAG: hypothetical protein RMM58_04365 [Chloroflexota bacterium]|nr:hypothetical protein [Dehalococcoidia bacterium]MDW8253096.1 hypothetical protein [Chloroflexota bacterium]